MPHSRRSHTPIVRVLFVAPLLVVFLRAPVRAQPATIAEPSPPAASPPAAPAVTPATPPAASAAPIIAQPEPLAGVSDGTIFLRSPDDAFVFFPNGRLQLDTYVFHSDNKTPNDTFLIRRARLELAGWIAGVAFFHLAGDFAAGVPATSGVPKAAK